MSEVSENSVEVEELLLRILAEKATPEEITRLEGAIHESEELRSKVSLFLLDDSLLTELSYANKQAANFLGPATSSPLDKGADTGNVTPKGLLRRVCETVNRHGVAVGTIAAMLVIGQFLYIASMRTKLNELYDVVMVTEDPDEPRGGSTDGTGDNSPAPEAEREVVGRVSGLRDPVWADNSPALGFGDHIRRGQRVQIESGLVELLLVTGAKLTIEGPADFEATSTLESNVLSGKIAAAAPRVARGYTVLTPTAELVDIGTQFGVVVEESGDSELHVFDGDVIARSRFAEKGSAMLHAGKSEAMRFSSASKEPKRFEARETDFIRHVTPLKSPEELPPLPLTDSLALWYSADMCSGYDDEEGVGCWNDLLVGDNDFADNAWQFDDSRRPKFVHDGEGRPAIRFDGWSSYFETSPMAATDQQTVLVVCAPGPMNYADGHVGQVLFKYGLDPTLELSVLSNREVRGWAWNGGTSQIVGEVRSKPIDSGSPVAIAYTYDVTANKSQLWVNRKLQGAADAPISLSESAQRFIGTHPHRQASYFGVLYEVVVFDKALTEQQLSEFWNYFSERYVME